MSERGWRLLAKRLHDAAENCLNAIPDDPDYVEDRELAAHDRAFDRLCKALAAYRKTTLAQPTSGE